MGRSNGLFAAIVIVLVSNAPAHAAPYHSITYRLSIELPEGWEAIQGSEMKSWNASADRVLPGMEVKAIAAFGRAKSPHTSNFIWLQHDQRVTATTTFDELKQELSRDFPASRRGEPEAFLRLARRGLLPEHQPEFDPVRQRFTARGKLGSMRTYTVGYLRSDGLFILHAWGRDGGSEAELAPLVKACDSFQFDEPEKPASLMDRVFGDKVGQEGRMAIVGATIAILIVGVGSLLMREKPARQQWRY